jgi:bifunctional non-homologous end joining protein LigD
VNGELRYFGRVGTGFRDEELVSLRERLDEIRRPTPPCVGAVPQTRGNVWVEPRLVGEVSFSEVTSAGSLRHPLWIGLRDDKDPSECTREGPSGDGEPEPPTRRPPTTPHRTRARCRSPTSTRYSGPRTAPRRAT